ncbi:Chromate transporter like protein, partial [Aduncisulcus paluster]
AQSFPGALAINTSIYVGYKLRKHIGALVACLGLILPPLVIISGAAALILQYGQVGLVKSLFMGVRPAVAGLIAAAVLRLASKLDKNIFNGVMAVLAFIFVAIVGVHPIGVIIASGLTGYAVMRWIRGEKE